MLDRNRISFLPRNAVDVAALLGSLEDTHLVLCRALNEKAERGIHPNTISLHRRYTTEYNANGVRDMDDDATALQLAVIVAFVAVMVGFLAFLMSEGFLEIAIKQAIEDGRVILGMTKDDVLASWGWPSRSEEHSIELMDVDELVALTWTYEGSHCQVHFSNDGIVIWVACDSES